jgi:hypothetical protein
MILRDQMLVLLLEACPTFKPYWDIALKQGIEQKISNIFAWSMGHFAKHLEYLDQQNYRECFSSVGKVIERFRIEGDDDVKHLAATIEKTIGHIYSRTNVVKQHP